MYCIGEYSNDPTEKEIRNEMAREIGYKSFIYTSLYEKSPATT
jgi:hypothetical protein